MLIGLQVVATHLAITVEVLSHVELSSHYTVWSASGKGEEGSLHQLCT